MFDVCRFLLMKKSGIPKISNYGLADFVLGGKGFTVSAFSLIYDDLHH